MANAVRSTWPWRRARYSSVGHQAVAVYKELSPGLKSIKAPFDNLPLNAQQSTLASINLYAVSAFFVKLSLFLLYLRLFKPNKVTRWLIYGGIVACGTFYSSSLISNCALCIPKPGQPNDAASWSLRAEQCSLPSQHLAIAQGVFGTISDIYLLVIPIHSIFQLKLPTERKIGVSAIFMIGIMSVYFHVASTEKDIFMLIHLQRHRMLSWLSWLPYTTPHHH